MKNLVLMFFLAAMAILSFLLVKNVETDLAVTESKQAVRPVAEGFGVTVRYFDNKELKYLIVSEKVIDYSQRYGTRFIKPDVELYDKQQLSWTAVAQAGFLTGDKNDLTLTDDVQFVDDPKGEKPLFINGSVMYYNVPGDTMSSDQPSVIDDGVIKQESEQFALNTVSKVIHFSESIQGRYATDNK